MTETEFNLAKVLKVGRLAKLSLEASDELMAPGSRSGDRIRAFSTLIEDLSAEEVVVAWPTDQTVHVPAFVGQNVTLEIRSQRGVVCLDSRIRATKRRPLPVLHIARDGHWSRKQLRSNFRLDVAIRPREAIVISKNGLVPRLNVSGREKVDVLALKKSETNGDRIKASIRNLSAAGCLLASAIRLERGSVIGIRFPLGEDQGDIKALAMVVRIVADSPDDDTYPFRAGCRFLDLGMKDQDRIAKFLLARQAELRRGGLL